MTLIQIIGFSASLLSILNQFPQAIKVFKTKDTISISLLMYCLLLICISLWLIYGIILNIAPIILANSLSLIPVIYIFIIKLKNTITKIDKKLN